MIHPKILIFYIFIDIFFYGGVVVISNYENLGIINIDTGEVKELGHGIFTSEKVLEQRRNYFKKQEEFKLINSMYKSYGNFSWLIFKYCEELFPNMKLGHLTRLLYLSTFITYDGILKTCDKVYMTKTNMNNVLKLSTKQFYEFYNEMIDNNIIIEDKNKDCLFINTDFFFKGNINGKSRYNNLIRLNHETIRKLYRNTPVSKHKSLAYVFKLIPYINKEYNVLCENPLEEDIDRLILLNKTSDIARICNYSESKSKRLYDEISKITLDNHPVIKIYQDVISKDIRIFANPKCYYAGSDYGKVRVLGAFY